MWWWTHITLAHHRNTFSIVCVCVSHVCLYVYAYVCCRTRMYAFVRVPLVYDDRKLCGTKEKINSVHYYKWVRERQKCGTRLSWLSYINPKYIHVLRRTHAQAPYTPRIHEPSQSIYRTAVLAWECIWARAVCVCVYAERYILFMFAWVNSFDFRYFSDIILAQQSKSCVSSFLMRFDILVGAIFGAHFSLDDLHFFSTKISVRYTKNKHTIAQWITESVNQT